ncbi:hypothetical protein Zmor_027843 [Zophobas morio]|uniref:Reverse transcriptase domain-containing protein n=1 Tax=Zophobas morio TaxID=2755281 RepID=A0AA38M2U6_9CUCU|nr:hypothetical protein Zmor_027843 [Zophobas morio]
MGEITKELVAKTFENFRRSYRKVDINDTLDRILERQLPKICINDTSKLIINKVNEVLSAKLVKNLSIEDLHTLTYCGAKTVAELCEPHRLVYHQSEIPTKFPEDADGQETLFRHSPQRFRRLLFNDPSDNPRQPSEENIKQVWTGLWEEESHYKPEEALQYIEAETARIEMKKIRTNSEIRMADLNRALKKKKNWSPPGIDGVQTFWYKKFKPVRKALLQKINDVIKGEQMPEFFTVGFTELHSKGGNTEDASNYRPITHLPAIYKIITRCVYQKIFQHYSCYNILADEQCGGRKDCYGVRKALVIDSVALDQEEVQGYYVDFKKAFDSVPHDWILKVLRIYKVNEDLVKFLENGMSKWKTRIHLKPNILTSTIQLKKGVFQGDSTSVILFWTAINPLSFALRATNVGLKLRHGSTLLSHVLYMDDLKLYASNPENLRTNYNEVEKFTKAISMTINTKKTHEFWIPERMNTKMEVVYLGYIQSPKIESPETIYHKVRKFDDKCKKIASETKISEEDKTNLKKQFVFNSIFNSFGILHWKLFKRELLKTEVRKKFLPLVQERDKDLALMYLKLINDMCKIRRTFIEESRRSDFIKSIVENDNVTPLRLSVRDESEYVKLVVAEIKEKKQRKRKVTERE